MGLYRSIASCLDREVDAPVNREVTGSNDNDAFISVWLTSADGDSITIPAQGGTFNAVVDWGDNSSPETVTSPTGFVHDYDTAGFHTISITGTFPNIFLHNATDRQKIQKVLNLGKVGWTSFSNAFRGCSNLTEFTGGSTDTSNVQSMSDMFRSCTSLTSLDVSSFDTSNVSSMDVVFFSCTALTNINVSNFDTSSATRMNYMFYNCSGLTNIDVSSFNTSNVTTLSNMFTSCTALTSIVGAEDFDLTSLTGSTSLTNFLTVGSMTIAQYDNLLVKWRAQDPLNGLSPSFGASTYTGGSAAATARQELGEIDGWQISDGGIA